MFFQEYAEENGFNPLDSEAWYLQPKEELMSRKVGLIDKIYSDNINNFLLGSC